MIRTPVVPMAPRTAIRLIKSALTEFDLIHSLIHSVSSVFYYTY